MTSTGKEWFFVIVFFAGFLAITAAEVRWLIRSKSIAPKRAALFVLVPNFLVITAGLFISFVIFAVALSSTSNGSALILVAVLIPMLMMILIRRFLFKLLQGEESAMNRSPWVYSIVSTALFFIAVFVPSSLIFLF